MSLEPPSLDLDFREKITVRVGEPCLIQSRYKGKPEPTIKWMKEEEELKADEDLTISHTAKSLSVNIAKAKREHSGKYTVTLENSIGSCKGICTLTVVGKLPIHQLTLSINNLDKCTFNILLNFDKI